MLGWLRHFARGRRAAASGEAGELHRRGVEANRAGRHAEAAELVMRAIRADARVAEFHYELGRAMRALGEPERAVTCFREALAIDPAHGDAHIDLASVMLAAGNVLAAEESARAALALDAGSIAALVNLGAALEGQGRFEEAARAYRAALQREPDFLPALANLANVLLRTGDVEGAEDAIRRTLAIAPQSVDALLQQAALRLEQCRPEEAIALCGEALRLHPGHAPALGALGFGHDLQGRLDDAVRCYDDALAADPRLLQARANRAAIRLLREDYAGGWDELEARLAQPDTARLHARFGVPAWDGGALAGKRVLVHAEQGLGDELLFASCLPDILEQARHCVIDCEPRLAGLFRRSFPGATVHGGRQSDPADWLSASPVDVRVPAGSLPRHFRRKASDFPRHAAYLAADPARVRAWRARLDALGPGRKIGISWRGGVPQTGRGSRSIALEALLPVLRTPGARFVSLQYGPAEDEIARLRERHGVDVVHWPEAIGDYEDTAALVCALDLTVAVTTTVVDLAGALGRPVWTLAPVRPDFRYGLAGEAMRWYPSARVFRQSRYGEWTPVIEAVAGALAQGDWYPASQRQLADLLNARGRPAEAFEHAGRALEARPGWADAQNSAGVALQALGHPREAIARFEAALAADPGHAPACVNLGHALLEAGDADAALARYRQAVALDPADASAQIALAMALEDGDQCDEARAAYERALALAPSDGIRVKLATLLPIYPRSSQEIDGIRARLDAGLDALLARPMTLKDPVREVGQTAFLLPYQGRNDRDLLTKLATLYERACPSLRHEAPLARRPRDRVRVGFASAYFTSHSVGVWYNQLIALLAAEPGLEVVLVDLGGNADPALRAACARAIAPPRELSAARAAIAAEDLDVLVYADIGMDPFGYFLAFSRLAPVQCSTFGHPETSGLASIDWFLSSALFEAGDADAHYRERLARLDALPLFIPRPAPPARVQDRAALGLPADRTLYACPMMLHKFHPDFDAAMAGILRRDPRGEILLFRDPHHPRRHERLLARFAAAHPDVAGRLRFRPWAGADELLNLIRASDVALDTFHFGAGTTAFLVLAFGTPLVTLPGAYARARPTLGCYRKMDMMDCVARDPEHYVELAVRIGTDAGLRQALRAKILERCGTLFSDRAAVRAYAGFLRRVGSGKAAG